MPKTEAVKILDHHVIYDNPMPQLRSRHGYFPGLVQLPSGELLALFVIGEAFESVDLTTHVARSADLGKTWQMQGPLYDKSVVGFPTSDTLKATVLSDGSLIAVGYRFHRRNPNEALGNPLTNGLQPADDIVSFSQDGGRTWSIPKVLPLRTPEAVEISGQCIELDSGDLLACGGLFPLWDGTLPSGQKGVLLRSKDKGQTWDDGTFFFTTPDNGISPFETRLCRMDRGRIVAMAWAFDLKLGKSLSNHITVSHDNGYTWSKPLDIGIHGQASNLIWLGGDQLLTIHAIREGAQDQIGLYVYHIDFSRGRWRVVSETKIWGNAPTQQSDGLIDLCKSLRFGQPSLLRLTNGELLATHWCIEEGQGKILTHRITI
jgi:sialidase-1